MVSGGPITNKTVEILVFQETRESESRLTRVNTFDQQVDLLVPELGVALTLEELESAMRKHRPAVVFVVHAESSTGLRQPLEGVGDIVHK